LFVGAVARRPLPAHRRIEARRITMSTSITVERPTFMSVTIDRLYAGSIYKLIGIGLTCCLVPFSLVLGLLSLTGLLTFSWNAKPIMGLWALALSPVAGVLVTLALTFTVGSACVLGLWFYSKFRPIVLWGRNALVT
jgi:hypothetical protein